MPARCCTRTEAGHYDAAVVEQAQLIMPSCCVQRVARRILTAQERCQSRVIVSQQLFLACAVEKNGSVWR
jgi:hypothetical protein